MPSSITLPPGYGYVAAGFVCTAWVLGWQALVVGSHRTKSGIKYPQLYAEKAEAAASKEALLFNCAQRSHQNTIEHMPLIILTTLVTAMKYPVFAGYACGFWALSRVLYTLGYTTGDPVKRNTRGGILGEIPLVGLLLGSTYTAFDLLRSSA
ncbi:membrane-associated proteins in eicosanoid and glutathione metabolism [Rhizopogon vinicolor AM-OR11-026]|uniref:Membrane-associated proteins in eicosanoid and glutathione metabolism n=1 Tax=Rhizopogon vinicolor AM-OR11-026 TaxID=1314800 RepID=A0A1B7MZ75_9AGAM|nr:membrane-associated proteins in eicosanoid and glutathione metabolism [Rhizopogon vinicolor AM-OR11-026]